MRWSLGLGLLAGCAGDAPDAEDSPADDVMLVAGPAGAATVAGEDNSLIEDDPAVDPVANETAELTQAELDLANLPDPSDDPAVVTTAATTPTCTKHVSVTLISYTGMGVPASNGCWHFERPRQEPDNWRICHFDGPVTQGTERWFYDDVNPFYHTHQELIDRIHSCGFAVTSHGYELLASHDGAWRLVATRLASLYYAELYTDNAHVADAWASYRYSQTLRDARRLYHISPIVNVGTDDSLTSIRTQLYKICRRVKSYRHLGIYAESGHPLGVVGGANHSVARMHMIEQALDACTTH